MSKNSDRAVKYGTGIYALLMVVAFVIAYFMYSLITGQELIVDDYIMEIDPPADFGPDYEPRMPEPTSPPPS